MHLAPVAMSVIVASFCILLVMAYRTAQAQSIVKKLRVAQLPTTAREKGEENSSPESSV